MGIVGRNYGAAASKRPTPVVEASRGAAAAPGAASIPAGGGGGIANDIAGLVGIGGGILGRFLWDKYKKDPTSLTPEEQEQLSGQLGIPEGTPFLNTAPDKGWMDQNGQLGGQIGINNSAVDVTRIPADTAQIGGQLGLGSNTASLVGSNFGGGAVPVYPNAGLQDLYGWVNDMEFPQYIV